MLLVITGPIASGKSTLARAVACEFETRGFSAAAVDLDLVYEMLNPSGAAKSDRLKWSQARRVSARLAESLLLERVAIIVEGEFLTATERAEFNEALVSGVEPRFVTLRIDFDIALKRTRINPTRGISQDAAFLRDHYDTTAASVRGAPKSDLVLDTGIMGIAEASRAVADWALSESVGALVVAVNSSRPPAGVKTRIIAIDGPGGAGKSSLANLLAGELGAPVIHTDDFASWDNPIDWWPDLIERALKPLAAGRPAHYQPTSWGHEDKQPVLIQPGGTVILEGVTASREAFRRYLAYLIWIETRRELRLQRGIDRDGEQARRQWEGWMQEEDRCIECERPSSHADIVLRGDQGLWT